MQKAGRWCRRVEGGHQGQTVGPQIVQGERLVSRARVCEHAQEVDPAAHVSVSQLSLSKHDDIRYWHL